MENRWPGSKNWKFSLFARKSLQGNFLREKYFNFVEISSFRENKKTKKVIFTSRLYQGKMQS